MPEVDQFRIKSFKTPKEFSTWLEYNHDREVELWLKIFKKGSGEESINWNEAVIEALCWGWIDGVKKSLDSQAFLQRFTPRRLGSIWSKRNTEHAESLIKEGRMKEAGLKHIQAAKEDGRWEAAYAPSSEVEIPSDFLSALEANLTAKKNFEALSKSAKFNILFNLHTTKKVETKQRRLKKFIEMLNVPLID